MSATEQKGTPTPARPELEVLRRFLDEHVESLAELSVLAVLRARGKPHALLLEAIVGATELPQASVEEALARLESTGLVVRTNPEVPTFVYAESGSELTALLERAIAEYERDPLQVMGLMTANAIERVRGAARRTFGESLRGTEPKKGA